MHFPLSHRPTVSQATRRELNRVTDGAPVQEELYEEWIINPAFWAYVVEVRMRIKGAATDWTEWAEWTDWVPHWEKPNHFRSEAGADRRYGLLLASKDIARKIELGLLDMRVRPKYIGCNPGKDEAWIAD